jgi:predicted secreted Zn-dependent protease
MRCDHRRAYVLGLAVLATSVAPQLPAAAPITTTVTVTTNFYTVTGSTRAEILASQARDRPWRDKGSYDACTEWGIRWGFNYRERNGRFELGAAEITTVVTVNLPRWSPPDGVSTNLLWRWSEYIRALGIHELGHVTLARLATAALRDEFELIASYGSAQDLTAAVESQGKQVVANFRQKENDYDRKTRHGFTQGARLKR